jgi:hypothetical protein
VTALALDNFSASSSSSALCTLVALIPPAAEQEIDAAVWPWAMPAKSNAALALPSLPASSSVIAACTVVDTRLPTGVKATRVAL